MKEKNEIIHNDETGGMIVDHCSIRMSTQGGIRVHFLQNVRKKMKKIINERDS